MDSGEDGAMRILICLFLLSFSAEAYADGSLPSTNDTVVPLAPPSTEPPSTLAPKSNKQGKFGNLEGGKKKKEAVSEFVRGHCTLLESPLNPITGPCISVPLELRDARGQSLGISRTSAQGDFEFAVEGNGPFTLAPSSSYYVLVAPMERIRRGDRVDLRIREKN